MLREIEHYKQTNPNPYQRGREVSDDYIKPREGLSSHLLKTVSASPQMSHHYEHLKVKHSPFDRKEERQRLQNEYDKHYPVLREGGKLPPPERRDYPPGVKREYPGGPTSVSFPSGLPPRITSSYPWSNHSQQPNPSRPSPGSNSMPHLLNIRSPFTHSGFGSSGEGAAGDPPKLSKSEIEARHQAVSTYLQMWANGQHNNLTPEQLFAHPPERLLSQIYRYSHPATPTDPTSIAVAAAKEPNDRHPYNIREGVHYGVHPVNTKWQPVSFLLFCVMC